MARQARMSVFAVIMTVALSGCAHYYFPANPLETSETFGQRGRGRIELVGFSSGADLVATPIEGETGTELQATNLNYTFGVSYSLSERVEVGLRYSIYAPMLLRVKYQLFGPGELQAKRGDLSGSVFAAPGYMIGNAGTANQTYTYLGAGGLLGWRPWSRHLFSAGPFYSMANLSGDSTTTGSGSQMGAVLSYQYSIEDLFLRAEEVYDTGTYQGSRIKAFYGAAQVGFKF